jgi:flavin reductase (DIM6/NTAB) family NADH-FMN oxidoreductase RutF
MTVTRPSAQLSAADFTAAFRHHPAGVSLITADVDGRPVALTASSVTSVSADPPLLAFSLSALGSSAERMSRADTVVVHLLGAEDVHLARLGASSGVDRFADPTAWSRLPTGEPVFPTRVWLRARVLDRVDAGGSTVVVAQALQASVGSGLGDREGLVYLARTWHRLGEHSRVA